MRGYCSLYRSNAALSQGRRYKDLEDLKDAHTAPELAVSAPMLAVSASMLAVSAPMLAVSASRDA